MIIFHCTPDDPDKNELQINVWINNYAQRQQKHQASNQPEKMKTTQGFNSTYSPILGFGYIRNCIWCKNWNTTHTKTNQITIQSTTEVNPLEVYRQTEGAFLFLHRRWTSQLWSLFLWVNAADANLPLFITQSGAEVNSDVVPVYVTSATQESK